MQQEDWELHWKDYYKILQVHSSAEPEIIEAAYKRLVKKYHPEMACSARGGKRTGRKRNGRS